MKRFTNLATASGRDINHKVQQAKDTVKAANRTMEAGALFVSDAQWRTYYMESDWVKERIKDVIEQGNPWAAGKLLTEANKLLGTAKAYTCGGKLEPSNSAGLGQYPLNNYHPAGPSYASVHPPTIVSPSAQRNASSSYSYRTPSPPPCRTPTQAESDQLNRDLAAYRALVRSSPDASGWKASRQRSDLQSFPSFNYPQPMNMINVTYNLYPGYGMPPPGPVLSPVYPDMR